MTRRLKPRPAFPPIVTARITRRGRRAPRLLALRYATLKRLISEPSNARFTRAISRAPSTGLSLGTGYYGRPAKSSTRMKWELIRGRV